jgi:HPt (histidine-containing phosphotransfer) domain-containing protein
MLSRRILRSVLHAPDGAATGSGAFAPAASTAEADTVLDEEALRRLRELDPKGTNRLLERVFEAFEASAGRLIPQMELALRSSDAAGVRHVAHTLKSSSASIGAMRLSSLCAEIEAMIRRDANDGLAALVEDASRESGRVLQAMKRLPLVPT